MLFLVKKPEKGNKSLATFYSMFRNLAREAQIRSIGRSGDANSHLRHTSDLEERTIIKK